MERFLKSLERLATAKGIVALLLLALVAVFVYRNLDFLSEVTFRIKSPYDSIPAPEATSDTESKHVPASTGIPDLIVRRVELSRVAFSIPNYFVLELLNSGGGSAEADLTIDFGRALIDTLDLRPRENLRILAGGVSTSALKVHVLDLGPEESAYVYALLSVPVFDRIVLDPHQGTSLYSLTYGEWARDAESMPRRSGFRNFLVVVAGGVILVFTVYLVAVVISLLNRRFRI